MPSARVFRRLARAVETEQDRQKRSRWWQRRLERQLKRVALDVLDADLEGEDV